MGVGGSSISDEEFLNKFENYLRSDKTLLEVKLLSIPRNELIDLFNKYYIFHKYYSRTIIIYEKTGVNEYKKDMKDGYDFYDDFVIFKSGGYIDKFEVFWLEGDIPEYNQNIYDMEENYKMWIDYASGAEPGIMPFYPVPSYTKIYSYIETTETKKILYHIIFISDDGKYTTTVPKNEYLYLKKMKFIPKHMLTIMEYLAFKREYLNLNKPIIDEDSSINNYYIEEWKNYIFGRTQKIPNKLPANYKLKVENNTLSLYKTFASADSLEKLGSRKITVGEFEKLYIGKFISKKSKYVETVIKYGELSIPKKPKKPEIEYSIKRSKQDIDVMKRMPRYSPPKKEPTPPKYPYPPEYESPIKYSPPKKEPTPPKYESPFKYPTPPKFSPPKYEGSREPSPPALPPRPPREEKEIVSFKQKHQSIPKSKRPQYEVTPGRVKKDIRYPSLTTLRGPAPPLPPRPPKREDVIPPKEQTPQKYISPPPKPPRSPKREKESAPELVLKSSSKSLREFIEKPSNKDYGIQCRGNKTYYTYKGKVTSKKHRDEYISKDARYKKNNYTYKCVGDKVIYYNNGVKVNEDDVPFIYLVGLKSKNIKKSVRAAPGSPKKIISQKYKIVGDYAYRKVKTVEYFFKVRYIDNKRVLKRVARSSIPINIVTRLVE